MTEQKSIFIGIGSNVGNRLSHLQLAVEAIHYEVGSVLRLSSCYETPVMGFKGDAFLNACLQVRTCLSSIFCFMFSYAKSTLEFPKLYPNPNENPFKSPAMDVSL